MCQEKVENKIKFSGSCMDVNTGAEVIFEGYREGGNLLLEAKCISDILKKQAVLGQKAQQFLGAVRSTLKKCKYLSLLSSPEQNVSLFCEIRRKCDGVRIGYVEDTDYLLDCEYFYMQIFKPPVESLPPVGTFLFPPSELAYYSELFQLGVLKPYMNDSSKEFYMIEDFDKRYIRVSNALVNFDIAKSEIL